LGTPAAVAVPAVDELDPSGEIVPLTTWRVTQVGAGGGRPWRLRTATDSRVQDRPTPTSGLCVALEEAPFPADEAPPSVYDCLPPGLLLARRVPQGLRGRVLVGTTGRPTPTLAITFDDGSTATLDATSGAFVVFTDGRKVRQPAELAG
jgi:hypothetical protein